MFSARIIKFGQNPSLWLGFLFLALYIYGHNWPVVIPPKAYATPPEIKHFTFGYNEQIADILWVRAIQDFDFCSEKINATDCKGQSWLFHMIDRITELSPKFRMPYSSGGIALTILVNDYEGATKIFDKAVVAFPNDYPILSRAAYHAIYEEKDNVKAAKLLRQAAQAGGPAWYYTLAGRLYTESGKIELGESIVAEMKASGTVDPSFISRLEKKIAEHKEKVKKSPK